MDGLSYIDIKKELDKFSIDNFEIIYMDSVDSTNRYAMEHADKKTIRDDINNLVVANNQTNGKGRLGRTFESEKDKGVFATLVLRPEKKTYEVANITLVIALALARALDEIIDTPVNIKWPNDIILNGKKLSGILTEMRNVGEDVKHIIAGIGINVNNEAFSKEITNKATSLYLETGKKYSRAAIIARMLKHFNELYKDFIINDDLSFMLEEYNGRLINRNEKVLIEYKGRKEEAIQLGVDKTGELKVVLEGEERCISSGEILVRGVHGYV